MNAAEAWIERTEEHSPLDRGKITASVKRVNELKVGDKIAAGPTYPYGGHFGTIVRVGEPLPDRPGFQHFTINLSGDDESWDQPIDRECVVWQWKSETKRKK